MQLKAGVGETKEPGTVQSTEAGRGTAGASVCWKMRGAFLIPADGGVPFLAAPYLDQPATDSYLVPMTDVNILRNGRQSQRTRP